MKKLRGVVQQKSNWFTQTDDAVELRSFLRNARQFRIYQTWNPRPFMALSEQIA